jgi:hypothetical protein
MSVVKTARVAAKVLTPTKKTKALAVTSAAIEISVDESVMGEISSQAVVFCRAEMRAVEPVRST